jgi:Sigma-70 region 2
VAGQYLDEGMDGTWRCDEPTQRRGTASRDRGRAGAFTEFYRRHVARVTGMGVRRFDNPEDVADFVATVFLEVLDSADGFDPGRGGAVAQPTPALWPGKTMTANAAGSGCWPSSLAIRTVTRIHGGPHNRTTPGSAHAQLWSAISRSVTRPAR